MYILNDKEKFNLRYRSELLKLLKSKGVHFESLGFFDNTLNFIKLLFILFFTNRMIISSNLKSNTLVMLFFWKRAGVIVNGLGRYKKIKLFRFFWLLLLNKNKNKIFTFQNYLDYRYFKSHSCQNNIHWVPGSGGKKKNIGNDKNKLVVVSRDEKIKNIQGSICDFLSKCSFDLVIVGCSQSAINETALKSFNPLVTGYVNQSDIMSFGGAFLQPAGYGEGIPHTLVDAISSGVTVYITKQQLLEFGLNKLGFRYTYHLDSWVKIEPNKESIYLLSAEKVSAIYCDYFINNSI